MSILSSRSENINGGRIRGELTPTGMAVSGEKHCNVLKLCGTYVLNSLWEIVVDTQNVYNMALLITQSLYLLLLIPMAFVPYAKYIK